MTKEKLEAEIASWRKYAEAEKKAAEANRNNFCLWRWYDQRYCAALTEISKLEKTLALINAGWGSINS